MGLFKRKKAIEEIEIETCVIHENMWNVFNKMPRYVKGERLVWIALSDREEEYPQYALLNDNRAEIEDGVRRLLIEPDGFTYKDVHVYRCKKIVVTSTRLCSEFGCKGPMLRLTPNSAMKRLWRLYEKYKAKKITV
jgi:hypothetical protein